MIYSNSINTVQTSRAVKIPESIFDRAWIKLSFFIDSLVNGVSESIFGNIGKNFSKAEKAYDLVISDTAFATIQHNNNEIDKIEKDPAVVAMKNEIRARKKNITTLEKKIDPSVRQKKVKATNRISLKSDLEWRIEAEQAGIQLLEYALEKRYEEIGTPNVFYSDVRKALDIYQKAVKGITAAYIKAQEANLNVSLIEVAVISLPLFISDVERKSMEAVFKAGA